MPGLFKTHSNKARTVAALDTACAVDNQIAMDTDTVAMSMQHLIMSHGNNSVVLNVSHLETLAPLVFCYAEIITLKINK